MNTHLPPPTADQLARVPWPRFRWNLTELADVAAAVRVLNPACRYVSDAACAEVIRNQAERDLYRNGLELGAWYASRDGWVVRFARIGDSWYAHANVLPSIAARYARRVRAVA
jgi:hypothetical protein